MSPQGNPPSTWSEKAAFAPTRWSVVVAAGGESEGTGTRRALEELIGIYWFPLYAFIRRQGQGPQQAEDLTQEFFTRLLEKEYLASADQSKGRFRSFLLTAAKRFMVNEWNKSQAQKRGGRRLVEWNALDAEARYRLEPADELTPERLFDRRWALAVLEQVMARLGREFADRGRGKLFEALAATLSEPDSNYAEIGDRLGMTQGAVKVAAHRLRRRYRDLLREEIAQTVAGPEEVEAEIRHLMECL